MKPVSEKAKKTAEAIYENLSDRRGIRQTFDEIDSDIIKEIKNDIAAIIDEKYGGFSAARLGEKQ